MRESSLQALTARRVLQEGRRLDVVGLNAQRFEAVTHVRSGVSSMGITSSQNSAAGVRPVVFDLLQQ